MLVVQDTRSNPADVPDLDNAKISQSHRHPTLVTLTVDGIATSPASQGDHHWRLPSTDPRDEGNYLFRLHTLDIYFWTAEDARHFLQNAQQILRPQQFNVDAPSTPVSQSDAMSPVVQNLENVAISDPAYRHQQGRDSRAASTAAQVGGVASPPARTSPQEQQQTFTPLAYNPSAPPAPEEIKHREKTPPPEDAHAIGTGLAAAAYNDHMHAQGQHLSQSGHLPPPPSAPPPSHSPSIAQQRYVPQGIDPATYARTQGSQQPLDSPTEEILGASYGHGPRHSITHRQPQYMDYLSSRPAGASPPAAAQSPPLAGQHGSQHSHHHHSHHQQGAQQHQQAVQQQHQQGGYSPQFAGPPGSTGDSNIHSQVYVPGEGESAGFGLKPSKHGRASVASQGSQGSGSSHGQGSFGQGRLEHGAAKMEKGVNKWLRKVESTLR